MSAEALGWVYRHSPFKGTVFAVHLAMADSVSDTHENLFWMARANVATKARITGESVSSAVATLLDAGYIEPAEEGMDDPKLRQKAGHPARWRFLFPDVSVIYESRRSRATREGGSGSAARGSRLSRDVSQEEPKNTDLAEPPLGAPSAETSARAEQPKPRARNLLFDALVAAFGAASTPSRAKFYGKAVRELRAAGASPEQVQRARIAMSRRGWDSPTPEAMLKHWDSLLADAPPLPANPAGRRFWEEGNGRAGPQRA